MCYVIITCRSLGWTLLSITVTLVIVAAVVSPHWIIGMPIRRPIFDNKTEMSEPFQPTLGIFNRCTKYVGSLANLIRREHCATFVTSFTDEDSDFPHAWKAALISFSISGVLLSFAMIMSVFSLFVRSIFGKSIFTVSGLIQSIAGLTCVIGLVIYPAGWGSKRVKNLCGEYADPYIVDKCDLGWSFYLCIVGTVLVFLCSILSIQAEHSTSSRKVEEEVLTGKNLICVL